MLRRIIWALIGSSFALVSCGGGTSTSGSLPVATQGTPAAGATNPAKAASPVPTSTSASVSAPSSSQPSTSPTAAAGTSVAVPFAPTPDTDPFYAQPVPFPNLPVGTILASRSVKYAPYEGITLSNQAWELKFVSRDTNMQPIAAVAVVVKPTMQSPTVYHSVEPLLVFAYAEDSLGSECAPSHSVQGSQLYTGEQDYAAADALAAGMTLVYPDSEGPYSAYASGPLAAHIGLDSAIAAEQFAPLGLNAKTPVGIYGYSGGAFVSAWAATLQQTYAPNLNVVGIASGGTPANPEQIVQNQDTNQVSSALAFGLIMSAILGVNRSYPALLSPILNSAGITVAQSLANGCGGSTTNGASGPQAPLSNYTTTANPLNSQGTLGVLPLITLPLAGHTPITNVFVYHSQVDELIPIAGVDSMVAAWCAAGAQVEYYRGVNGEHVTFGDTSGPLAIAYLESRFIGTGPPVVPPTSSTCNQGGL